jgi:hypothetical protein
MGFALPKYQTSGLNNISAIYLNCRLIRLRYLLQIGGAISSANRLCVAGKGGADLHLVGRFCYLLVRADSGASRFARQFVSAPPTK